MSELPYAPLSCALHDRLEAAATLKRRVRLQYRTAAGTQAEEDTVIADILTRDGAEYLVLSSGGARRASGPAFVAVEWLLSRPDHGRAVRT